MASFPQRSLFKIVFFSALKTFRRIWSAIVLGGSEGENLLKNL